MDESFSTGTTTTSSTSSSSIGIGMGGIIGIGTTKKNPSGGEPSSNWTIEELLRWSLDQYRTSIISQTSFNIAALQTQCENECDDVKKLHEMALQLKMNDNNAAVAKESGATAGVASAAVRRREEENVNPQVDHVHKSTTMTTTTRKAMTATTTTITTAAKNNSAAVIGDTTDTATTHSTTSSTAITTTATTNNITVPNVTASTASASTTEPIGTNYSIEVIFTSGPHSSSSTPYILHPTLHTPCLIGRSKGKKFIKNGISLYKDQEVSTTHGKFIVEEKKNYSTNNGSESGSGGGALLSFYYVDVGSTNGTMHNGTVLEPNTKLLLVNGMELKIGNSTLMIRLGM
jgi:hypothetical protein